MERPHRRASAISSRRTRHSARRLQIQSNDKTSPLPIYRLASIISMTRFPTRISGEENRGYSTLECGRDGRVPNLLQQLFSYSPLVNYGAPLAANTTSALVSAARSDSVNPLTYLKTVSRSRLSASLLHVRPETDLHRRHPLHARSSKTFYSALQQAATGGTFAFSPGFGIAPETGFQPHLRWLYRSGSLLHRDQQAAQGAAHPLRQEYVQVLHLSRRSRLQDRQRITCSMQASTPGGTRAASAIRRAPARRRSTPSIPRMSRRSRSVRRTSSSNGRHPDQRRRLLQSLYQPAGVGQLSQSAVARQRVDLFAERPVQQHAGYRSSISSRGRRAA